MKDDVHGLVVNPRIVMKRRVEFFELTNLDKCGQRNTERTPTHFEKCFQILHLNKSGISTTDTTAH